MSENFPKFDDPPIQETVLGVMFKPIASWQIPHFGLFWREIREDYGKFSVQPPLPDELPKADGANQIMINLGSPQHRLWFFNDDQGWLVQVQNSRFVTNWRKQRDGSYPNYSAFLERYERDWHKFIKFLTNERLEAPELLQAEVSYINFIDIGLEYDKIPETFPLLSGFKMGNFLPVPDRFNLNTSYPIADDQGRLQISAQPVVRAFDKKEMIQLTVTAKTRIASNNDEAMRDAMNLGHEWAVRSFTDFTSPAMHKTWARTQ